MDRQSLRIRLYGVRGSYTPSKGFNSKVGNNTICIRVDCDEHILLFDAGSGIINGGEEILKQINASPNPPDKYHIHLFFTHMHLDHLEGFPYFPLVYDPRCVIHFFSPKILNWTIEKAIGQLVQPPFFPLDFEEMPFKRHFYQVAENIEVYFGKDGFHVHQINGVYSREWQLKISCLRNYLHPKGGSFFYKLETPDKKSAVFAYDTEGFIGGDQRLISFAQDAELLFHDAQYTDTEYQNNQGFGHSTFKMACEVAAKAAVKKLILIHHDPNHSDEALFAIEKEARKYFENLQLAMENQTFLI